MRSFRITLLGFLLAVSAIACTREEAAQSPEETRTDDVAGEPATGIADADVPGVAPSVDSVVIEPAEPVTGDSLEAVVTAGTGDLLFEYIWYSDGQRLAGENRPSLPGSYVQRGRTIHVEVTPVYEGEPGASVSAAGVTVVNSPPEVHDVRTVSLDGDRLVLQVDASDPDGDQLTYELKEAPDGMRIDASGRITWTVPEGGESVDYTVLVSDGEHKFEFDQTIGFETQRVEE